jgi:hypothetical protein
MPAGIKTNKHGRRAYSIERRGERSQIFIGYLLKRDFTPMKDYRQVQSSQDCRVLREGRCCPILTNLILYGNTAGTNGGGIYTAYEDLSLIATSFPDQRTDLIGEETAPPQVTNSILWDNHPNQISGEPADITCSNLKCGYSVLHNLNSDPRFVNAEMGDLRLQPESPSINSGNNQAVPPTVVTDLGGKSRCVILAAPAKRPSI